MGHVGYCLEPVSTSGKCARSAPWHQGPECFVFAAVCGELAFPPSLGCFLWERMAKGPLQQRYYYGIFVTLEIT